MYKGVNLLKLFFAAQPRSLISERVYQINVNRLSVYCVGFKRLMLKGFTEK